MLRNMVPAIKQTSTLWSEAMHLHPGAHQSDGTAGVGYQRNPNTRMLEEYDHHVLVVENVASFAGPAPVDVAVRFAKP